VKMNRDKIRSRVSSRLRSQDEVSDQRRDYLQKVSRLMCRDYSPTVRFTSVETACCRHSSGGTIDIEITKSTPEQIVSSIPDKLWSLVSQEAFLTHEIGHVLYTDFEAHEQMKEDLGMMEMSKFHDVVWNPAEDAAIEEQLRRKFSCSKELDILNANLFERQRRHAQGVGLMDATKIAILEKGCYEAGALEDHFDDSKKNYRLVYGKYERPLFENKVLPKVEEMLSKVMTEPDPEVRYDEMLQFWKWLRQTIDDDDNISDSSKRVDDDTSLEESKPDDTSGMTAGQDADELESLDEDDVREDLQQTGENDDTVDSGESGGEQSDAEDDSNPSDDGESSESGGEDAENASDSSDSSSNGNDSGNGDLEKEYPEHEGHRLVIKE
jgi:hypothetical protein